MRKASATGETEGSVDLFWVLGDFFGFFWGLQGFLKGLWGFFRVFLGFT